MWNPTWLWKSNTEPYKWWFGTGICLSTMNVFGVGIRFLGCFRVSILVLLGSSDSNCLSFLILGPECKASDGTQTPNPPVQLAILRFEPPEIPRMGKKTEMEAKIRRSVKIWCFSERDGWWVRCGSTLGIPTKSCWCFRKNSGYLANKLVIFEIETSWETYFYTPPNFNMAPEKWWLEDDPVLLRPGNFSYIKLSGGGVKNCCSQLWSLSIQTSQQRWIHSFFMVFC